MKTSAIIAVSSFALAHLVGAAPVFNNNKGRIEYSTTTEEVWETFWTTTTLWVDPSAAAAVPTTTPAGDFFELHGSSKNHDAPTTLSTSSIAISTPQAAAAPASSSTSVYVAPAPTSTSVAAVPTSTYVAPVQTSTYVAPTPTSTYVAPTPTSTYVAPAPTTTTEAAAVVAPTSTTPAASPAATTTSSSSSGSSGSNTGDLTYYDVSIGAGSCGTTGSNADDLVAMNHIDMANGANPNANPHCGQKINIYYNGAMHSGTVMDTCPACDKGSIDVTDTLFKKVAPSGDGRVHDVTWSWA